MFKFQYFSRFPHLPRQLIDLLLDLRAAHAFGGLVRTVVFGGYLQHAHTADFLDDGLGCDAVGGVVGLLDAAAALSLHNSTLH